MPRTSVQKSEPVPVVAEAPPKRGRAKKVAPVVEVPAVAPVVADSAPKKRGRKATVAPVVAEVVAPVEKAPRAPRVPPTRESVLAEYDSLSALIDAEILQLKESPAKIKGVKFLKTLNKNIKAMKAHYMRVMKQKSGVKRNNANSGFLKPVQISQELANFTGWDKNQPRSRVDVTKFICNYIKQEKLQKPDDGRVILVDKDAKLKKLLKYSDKENPLTFFRLQTCLKGHFTPLATVPEVAEPDVPAEVPAPQPVAPEAKPKRGRKAVA